ncbi:MAG: hypothetical protein DHS20C16_28490 [Phycisphaerae bacterium]|nr:MAG: hypothetical protein DHS20C16_28490 [Phycisphaerae bacterium]
MTRKEFIKESLNFSRGFTNQLLDKFESESDWMYQAHPKANHAMWCAGHLALTDDFFVGLLAPDNATDTSEAQKLFGMGTEPLSDAAAYPAPAEIRKRLNDARGRLLAVLDGMSEEDLDKPTPEGAPEFLPTAESIFKLAAFHEGIHTGQTTVSNQGLGHPPVVG